MTILARDADGHAIVVERAGVPRAVPGGGVDERRHEGLQKRPVSWSRTYT
jgi:hypothetical protein